ncbi:hypothetical protein BASA81_010621 [Batrachochytrium salamandrivorans]|nr:hypothetical protein BASA81_010621 [Batrachochytrium salamandrivorans]
MVSLPAGVQVQKPVGVLCTVHKCMASATAQLLHQARRLGFKLHDIPIKIPPHPIWTKLTAHSLSSKHCTIANEWGSKPPTRIKPRKGCASRKLRCRWEATGKWWPWPQRWNVHSSFLQWTHKNVGAYSLIADLACNGAWVRGEAVPIASNLSVGCEFWVNGKLAGEGHSDNVKPLQVYAKLLERFQPKPGDWITTGVVCDPPYHYGQRGDLLEARFSNGLGAVAVRLE